MKIIHYLVYILLFSIFSTIYVKASNKQFQGTLVVVNKKDDTVNFIDLQSRKIKFTRATGKGPHELAMSSDGLTAVVTNYTGGNSLTVFDVRQAKEIKTIDLPQYPRPHGILFLKDQRSVAVSSEGSGNVVIVDIISGQINKVIATHQKGSHMVAMPDSSERVYTTNMDSNTVSELDVETGALLRKISTPNTPEAITVNKDGTELWVGSNDDGFVSIYSLVNSRLIKQFKGFSFPYRVLLTQDEKFAVIPDYKGNTLDIFDVKNKKKLHQIKFGFRTIPNGVVYHPNDRTLFMSAYGKDKVIVIDIPSGEILFKLPTGDGPDGIGYSAVVLK